MRCLFILFCSLLYLDLGIQFGFSSDSIDSKLDSFDSSLDPFVLSSDSCSLSCLNCFVSPPPCSRRWEPAEKPVVLLHVVWEIHWAPEKFSHFFHLKCVYRNTSPQKCIYFLGVFYIYPGHGHF